MGDVNRTRILFKSQTNEFCLFCCEIYSTADSQHMTENLHINFFANPSIGKLRALACNTMEWNFSSIVFSAAVYTISPSKCLSIHRNNYLTRATLGILLVHDIAINNGVKWGKPHSFWIHYPAGITTRQNRMERLFCHIFLLYSIILYLASARKWRRGCFCHLNG